MSQNSLPPSVPNLLGTFASLLGVLGIFLYFTGWVYRWAYFSSFELELITLNLPLESFLIVPIQVFFGDFLAFAKAVLAVIVTVISIRITLWLMRSPTPTSYPKYIQKLHRFWIAQKFRSLTELLPQPFRNEIVVVIWILVVLFWLAQWQGVADARRDALNETSTRPMVTLVSPKDKLALGRQLGNLPTELLPNPSLKNYHIIGDKDLLYNIRGRETNDTTNSNQPIVWRLLLETDNWVYLFPALPPNTKPNQRPPVLVINTGDGRVQFLILSGPKQSTNERK